MAAATSTPSGAVATILPPRRTTPTIARLPFSSGTWATYIDFGAAGSWATILLTYGLATASDSLRTANGPAAWLPLASAV